MKRLGYRRIRHIEPAVAKGYKEFRSDTGRWRGEPRRPCRAALLVDDIIDLHAETAAVANKELCLLPAATDQQLDVWNTFSSKKPQLVPDKGSPATSRRAFVASA